MRKMLTRIIPTIVFLLLTKVNSFSQNIVTVTDCNLQGWVKHIQTGTTLNLVNGIGTPPLGKGSIEFSSPNVRFVRFRSTSYHNTLLSSITELSYDTYVQNRENNLDVNYVVLLVDINGDGSTDDNLVFDPRYQSGAFVAGNFPDQGLSIPNIWQTWDMLNGAWWLGPPPRPDPDNGGALFSLASYISQNPDARIINDAALGGGGIRLTGGAVPPIFAPNFLGNSDNFKIGINGITTTYDFEFSTANAGPDKYVDYGYGSNCVTLNGTAAGGVAPYSYLWSSGSSIPNNATTEVCPTVTTNYTLTVTDANGCSRTDEVTVFVNDVRCGSKLEKVKVCHNGEEICIAGSAIQAHLNHGDILGSCSQNLIITNNQSSSKSLRLSNYPNPFSNLTTIQYELPAAGKTVLKVYNMEGKIVRVIEAGYNAAGIHQIDFNNETLNKGIYFYQLTVNTTTQILMETSKMIKL